ncbi:MAG: bifunctional phosphoglucose/phosphomannose isomerase, partial [bacterium]|nr:bifunctional phosphoglucose/phosphomannose isomerase [bacterium]
AADILRMTAKDLKVKAPLYVHRNYNLPYWADKDCLAIFVSYSGNTEETLSAFQEGQRKKLPSVVITSGGKLALLANRKKIALVKIPPGLPPRMSMGLQFSALVTILSNCKLLDFNLNVVSSLEKRLQPKRLERKGKLLARKLKNRIPVIYASYRNKELARIWKIKFNENSKVPAFANYFPELNHNEMVGFERISSFQPSIFKPYILILKDPADHPRIQKRMKLTADILRGKKVAVDFIEINGKDNLSKVFSSLLLSDWASYYLALNYKVDPSPVKTVEDFKQRMK